MCYYDFMLVTPNWCTTTIYIVDAPNERKARLEREAARYNKAAKHEKSELDMEVETSIRRAALNIKLYGYEYI